MKTTNFLKRDYIKKKINYFKIFNIIIIYILELVYNISIYLLNEKFYR